jgi:hypothetical protein
MDCLITGGSIYKFDQVVLLLNGVTGRHQRYINRLTNRHPDIPWDTIAGPRGKGHFISDLQNRCVKRYANALYFKIDEDTFVSSDWADGLQAAYRQLRSNRDLALITPVIPNNALGFFYLLNRFPDLKDEYHRLFGKPLSPDCDGPVWLFPQIASWIMRHFLSLAEANKTIRRKAPCTVVEQQPDPPSVTDSALLKRRSPYATYNRRFSINCICYDYHHWEEIGGVPEQDEVGWGEWITQNNKRVYLCTETLVHHYSFFVQQHWLDRTNLLEEIRKANIPETQIVYPIARWLRIAKQLPRLCQRPLQTAHRTG